MTCEEFGRVLPELEGDRGFEQEEHLRTCRRCSGLVSDLNAIAQQAELLYADAEPSPRVWNSIELTLRQEGLIREAKPQRISVPSRPGWRLAWLVPVAAAVMVMGGIMVRNRQNHVASLVPPASTAPVIATMQPDEQALLKSVEQRTPKLGPAFESDLREVDAYIRDAEVSVRDNPNDEVAQHHLMNAYEQRAMVYEMASLQ